MAIDSNALRVPKMTIFTTNRFGRSKIPQYHRTLLGFVSKPTPTASGRGHNELPDKAISNATKQSSIRAMTSRM